LTQLVGTLYGEACLLQSAHSAFQQLPGGVEPQAVDPRLVACLRPRKASALRAIAAASPEVLKDAEPKANSILDVSARHRLVVR